MRIHQHDFPFGRSSHQAIIHAENRSPVAEIYRSRINSSSLAGKLHDVESGSRLDRGDVRRSRIARFLSRVFVPGSR